MEDEDGEGRIADVRQSTEDRKEDLGNAEPAGREETEEKSDSLSELYIATTSGQEEAEIRENEEEICRERILDEAQMQNDVSDETPQTEVILEESKEQILGQTQLNQPSETNNCSTGKKRREKRTTPTSITREVKRGKITEYAQYLGLQPASNKTNCTTCQGATTNSCEPLMLNQCTCIQGTMTQSTGFSSAGTSDSCASNPTTTPTAAQNSANNFRITRKVYLCAACGTYFENWNLFLHMREIHKRHICLFCLGMFGQAERLSYHLTKKHNVPETTFTSVEDFYNVFKGSCYLICCTCEKVFAETDNFYNHFCSPVQKGSCSVASEICRFCRQNVNNHSSMCTGGQTESRESPQTMNVVSPGAPSLPAKPADSKSIAQTNKRLVKNNRLKHNDFSALTSYQQRMALLYAKKPIIKPPEPVVGSELIEDSSTFGNFETGTTTTSAMTTTITTPAPIPVNPTISATDSDTVNALRDTVSETIMEVSKYNDESRLKEILNEPSVRSGVIEVNSSTVKIVSSPSPSFSSSSLSSPLRQQYDTTGCYDSVTETIMQVSRCFNDVESSDNDDGDDDADADADDDEEKEETNSRFGRNETSSRDSDGDALIMDDQGLSDNDKIPRINQHYDDRLNNSLSTGPKNERRRKRRKMMHRRNEENVRVCDTTDETSSGSENEATSPNREYPNTPSSIFRSRQEAERERRISQSSTSPEKESQATSVSCTTVNSTDRSLVIKICTNRNARFSVTRSSANGNNESHDTSRESEENNNAEDSASEDKLSNHSERGDRDSVNSHEEEGEVEGGGERGDENEEQSDNNSVKLSIDDTNKMEEKPRLSTHDSPAGIDEHIQVDNPESPKRETVENSTENMKSEEKINEETQPMDTEQEEEGKDEKKSSVDVESDGIILASEDVPSIDLNVDGILESMEIEDLLKRCISAASGYCVYCNHARHIAVNGKQLSLHILAEHRFQPQHPAIIIQREQLIAWLKKSLDQVETKFFNLDSYDSANGTYHVAVPRVFECFHCRYHSLVHKEIYLHNRKMHQKTILICIMCKSTFYSYSELLCHLCPGVYSPNINVSYRCCLCPVTNLPSAFRLMVHLRKRHHSCDVCLESTGNQQRLSNHVWKHKLHHLCYRCGIAYRNKPDITKHLFWKHGTESVLCKKCLQKKWPHVYHFCIPPTAFVCEECTSSFTRAVALKVHKRLHSGDRPYGCSECEERFISKKLAMKHEARHREPEVVEPEIMNQEKNGMALKEEENLSVDKTLVENVQEETTKAEPVSMTTKTTTTTTSGIAILPETTMTLGTTLGPERNENLPVPSSQTKEPKEPVKKVVDVYDLPPLNLSSDSDSDVEDTPAPEIAAKERADGVPEEQSTIEAKSEEALAETRDESCTLGDPSDRVVDVELNEEEKEEEAQIMDGIWDNFKSYAASLEQRETTSDEKKEDELNREYLCKIILADHDYCVVYPDKSGEEEAKNEDECTKNEDNAGTMEGEHDYGHRVAKSPSNVSVVLNCDSDTNTAAVPSIKRKKEKSPKKKVGSTSSSESSSDSDSSSCSCGTNCSCSSSSTGSSSSSSSSSDSDSSASESSPKKISARKERRRDKDKETTGASTTVENLKNDATKSESPEDKVEPINVEEEADRKENVEEVAEPHIEVNDRPASPQLIFRESDLDTDETETDEDFYDEHPQQLANKLLAEKRNQLMLLAAVAPPVADTTIAHPTVPENLNNGTLEPVVGNVNSVEALLNTNIENDENGAVLTAAMTTTTTTTASRKRVKMKKRKKSERPKTLKTVAAPPTPVIAPAPPTVESIKLNIPKSFYDKKTKKFGSKAAPLITVVPSRSSTPSMMNSSQHSEPGHKLLNDKAGRLSLGGSGSENENKRSSKRKRVPKRFYGDSSEDEATTQHYTESHHQQHYTQPSVKWRKVEQPPVVPSLTIKTPIQQQQRVATTPVAVPPSNTNYGTKSVTLRLSGFDRPMERIVPIVTGPSESEEQAESSTAESSENEEQRVVEPPRPTHRPAPVPHFAPMVPPAHVVPNSTHVPPTGAPVPGVAGGPERSVNLYCYCQCPYDEVSEMIACDGNDCRIEWFHFECVGIMVPPKGKWYCPDCRRKDSSLINDDFLE